MINDKNESPMFLGMGFAGVEVITDKNNQEPNLILPENIERPEPPAKRELGFNAAKVWERPKDHQREYFGIRAQSDKGRQGP